MVRFPATKQVSHLSFGTCSTRTGIGWREKLVERLTVAAEPLIAGSLSGKANSNWPCYNVGMTITPLQITTARMTLNWSNEDLANAAGIHKQTMWNIETGVYEPSPEVAEMIREALLAQGVELIVEESGAPGVRFGNATFVTG